MTAIIKLGTQDWTIDPGPWQATNVQFSGAMPGGHGSAQFEVPVSNAYFLPHHSLREGAWIVMYDDSHELYEGEIFSIKPSVDASGNHKLSVVCGGLISVAGKRADVSATWVHRGAEGWVRYPGTPSSLGNVTFDGGVIDLRASIGMTEDAGGTGPTNTIAAMFHLDSGLSDGTISHVDLAGLYDVTDEGGFDWTWSLYVSPDAHTWTISPTETFHDAANAAYSATITPTAGTKALMLFLWCEQWAQHTMDEQKYVTLSTCDIFSQGRTTKPRIDECMVSLATRTGLTLPADAVTKANIGSPLDDVRVGEGKAKVSAAAGLATIAGLHAQPFEWAFWDNKSFVVGPTPSLPDNDARVIVVCGGKPGLESWDVSELDEDCPQHCMVIYGNKDDPDLPQGYPRSLYVPAAPADTADLRIITLDYSGLILSDAAAFAVGANAVGSGSGGDIPSGAVWDANPSTADAGGVPAVAGNNTDPTSEYAQTNTALAHGDLTGFAYTSVSGWAGSGSPDDPACLVNPALGLGVVSFGDYGACDFGTGAFSARFWFKLGAAVVGDAMVIGGKMGGAGGATGWRLRVTSSQYLQGLVAASAANYRQRTGTTALSVGIWYDAYMIYAGSGGDITLWLALVGGEPALETTTFTGTLGAWNTDNTGNLQLFKVN